MTAANGGASAQPQAPHEFPHPSHLPFDPKVSSYDCGAWHGGGAWAMEYTDWREEVMSWKEGVGIHDLMPTPTFALRGPDTIKFLSDNCVNGFKKFPIGSARHGIMVNDFGNIMMHGMILRTGEEEVVTQWLAPWLAYVAMRDADKYDMEVEDQSAECTLFQVAGPKSLDTLEAAAGESLRDIGFIRHRESTIAGKTVRIVRVGMAGGLAYEVHSLKAEDAIPVYQKLLEAGEPHGIRRLGVRSYMLSHTENGFPQFGYHFPMAWPQDAGFMEFLSKIDVGMSSPAVPLRGSAGPDPEKRFRNPVELGWAHVVRLDHEFTGRAALEPLVAEPKRKMVSLEWNTEDILDVHRSQFEDGEPYLPMDQPNQMGVWPGSEGMSISQWSDDVLDADGNIVGISSGRAYSIYFRKTISIASIDLAHAEEGNELTLIWGDPGTRQKEIRVRVARFPYYTEVRNETVDVAALPAAS